MPFLVLGDKYARAVKTHAHAQPVLFPLSDADQITELLALVDGVMLTGSPSNVHPSRFGATLAHPDLMLDEVRDGLTLELVRACVAQAVPLLGICRGFQEINVAFGGTLRPDLGAPERELAHHAPEGADFDGMFDCSSSGKTFALNFCYSYISVLYLINRNNFLSHIYLPEEKNYFPHLGSA